MVEWNEHNRGIDNFAYEMAEKLAIDFINHKPIIYLVDGYLGWDPNYRLKVRSYCTRTYHALFLKNMLVRPTKEELDKDFTTSVDITLFNAG
jgi:phosphoenolpyruvate carboxykinase (ATP)